MDGTVATWSRATLWRQGSVLPAEAIQTLGLGDVGGHNATCAVIVSHDCDLANDDLQTEPNVEVIVGCHPHKPDGNYFWAKAPRTLHLEVLRNGDSAIIELVATAKHLIPKQALAAFVPDATYAISGKSLSALRAWLGVRYNRAAFPDLFVRLTCSRLFVPFKT